MADGIYSLEAVKSMIFDIDIRGDSVIIIIKAERNIVNSPMTQDRDMVEFEHGITMIKLINTRAEFPMILLIIKQSIGVISKFFSNF